MARRPRQPSGLLLLVKAAQRRTPSPNSSRAVCHVLLNEMRGDVMGNEDACSEVLAEGLNALVRRILKAGGDEEDRGVTTRQLEMFSPTVRGLVQAIDRARVFVPSRGEYVALEPGELTPDEVVEAGQHLISKGRETITRGEMLLQLANTMQADAA